MKIKLFREVPVGTVFKVMKESTRTRKAHAGVPASCPAPATGYYVKCGNGVSNSVFRKAKTIILGLTDVVQVISEPARNKPVRS